MVANVFWSGRKRELGVMGGPTYVRCDGVYTVDVKASPLPICPRCKRTDAVFNPTKGPYPSSWGCRTCSIEWGYYGLVNP